MRTRQGYSLDQEQLWAVAIDSRNHILKARCVCEGSVNAVQIWVQFDDATATVATDNNISLALSTLTVTAS